jgi:hypothetical protein
MHTISIWREDFHYVLEGLIIQIENYRQRGLHDEARQVLDLARSIREQIKRGKS